MASTVEQRLRSWERLLDEGGPRWLMEHAPRIVAELREELARAGSRMTTTRPATRGG